METIRVIGSSDSDLIQEFHIENTLMAMQRFVGGYIEQLTLPNGLLLICNEEGKILGLPPRLDLGYDIVAGNWFICAPGEAGEYRGLTADEFLTIVNGVLSGSRSVQVSLPDDVQQLLVSAKRELTEDVP